MDILRRIWRKNQSEGFLSKEEAEALYREITGFDRVDFCIMQGGEVKGWTLFIGDPKKFGGVYRLERDGVTHYSANFNFYCFKSSSLEEVIRVRQEGDWRSQGPKPGDTEFDMHSFERGSVKG